MHPQDGEVGVCSESRKLKRQSRPNVRNQIYGTNCAGWWGVAHPQDGEVGVGARAEVRERAQEVQRQPPLREV